MHSIPGLEVDRLSTLSTRGSASLPHHVVVMRGSAVFVVDVLQPLSKASDDPRAPVDFAVRPLHDLKRQFEVR
jgi:hypothetical protein